MQTQPEFAKVVAEPVMNLPSLSIRVSGSISLLSNLDVFGAKLREFVTGIDKEPNDDQGFVNLEAAVKTLKTAQDALEAAEANALAQTADIDEMRRTVSMYVELARSTRLVIEKVVKTRKDALKAEIVRAGKDAAAAHVSGLNIRIGKPYMPAIAENFAGCIKNLRTLSSVRNAVDTELARFKIEANAIADKIQVNMSSLKILAGEHKFLFADTAQLVHKGNDDLVAIIKNRIEEHKTEEKKKADELREKIRIEEEAKAKAKVQAEATAVVTPASPAPVTAAPATAIPEPARPVVFGNTEVWREPAPVTSDDEAILSGRRMLATFLEKYGNLPEFAKVVAAINGYFEELPQ